MTQHNLMRSPEEIEKVQTIHNTYTPRVGAFGAASGGALTVLGAEIISKHHHIMGSTAVILGSLMIYSSAQFNRVSSKTSCKNGHEAGLSEAMQNRYAKLVKNELGELASQTAA